MGDTTTQASLLFIIKNKNW